ncbi:unnamed protein product (macronuclear) [Paramecium tetraurelia]|uniref:Deoxyhypusine hydroxylase n=1 Tax=Paramecium tetraurelia TaxID=5888 RepID=A0C8W1_PARTE|nr:uncharacterized protein GSPATT00036363001 [Paramecium tetraurelia]CAK67228.1 unnamed protein product [Paramecium tetraurelia]|eukprot:XP_001434625.1 hypothetical protein (macronuclear) [Paramecium tetraurelia strain d4-2]
MEKSPQKFYEIIINANSTVDQIYTAIFELRTINNQEAVELLKQGFHHLNKVENKSCLLLHEIAYALGQADLGLEPLITQFLIQIISDDQQFDVVRHEGAEALANINQKEALEIFEKYSKKNVNDDLNILQDTCTIGLEKAKSINELGHLYGKRYLGTREPAAPFEHLDKNPVEYILDDQTTLFNKYRALYYLRNNAETYFDKIDQLLTSNKLGALFKHEICFVIGQVGEAPKQIHEALINMIKDENQPAIARHEAIAAFQTVSSNKEITLEILNAYAKSPDQIVRETAIVSLKMMEFYG